MFERLRIIFLFYGVFFCRYTGKELSSYCRSPITPMTALCKGEIIPPSHFMTSYVQQNRRSYQGTAIIGPAAAAVSADQIESLNCRRKNRSAEYPTSSLPKGSIKREATEIFSKDRASKVILDSILFL